MAEIEFEAELDSIVKTLEKIQAAIDEAEEDALESILDKGKEAAQAEVLQERRPYTTPHLHSSFTTHYLDRGEQFQGFVTNPLEHAAYVDQGVSGTEVKRNTPFEYDDYMPPIDEMIKYVKERMGGWDIDDPPYRLEESESELEDPDDSDPESGGEKEITAQSWKVGDVVTTDNNTLEIIEEDRDRGGFIVTDVDREQSSAFFSYEDAFDAFDHSLLNGNDADGTIAYRDKFQQFKANFASGTRWENSSETIDSLDDTHIIEFELERGDTAYGFVYPDEQQDDTTDTVLADVFALRPDSGDLQGEIVNNHDYKFGIEPAVEVNNPTRVWNSDELDSRPILEGSLEDKNLLSREQNHVASARDFTDDFTRTDLEVGDEVLRITSDDKNLRDDMVSRDVIVEKKSDEIVLSRRVVNIDDIVGVKTSKSATDVEEGDEIGVETGYIDDLDGDLNIGTVEEIYSQDKEGAYVNFKPYYGSKTYDLTVGYKGFQFTRNSRPGAWEVSRMSKGDVTPTEVTFEKELEHADHSDLLFEETQGYLERIKSESSSNSQLDGEAIITFVNSNEVIEEREVPLDRIESLGAESEIGNGFDAQVGQQYKNVDWIDVDESGLNKSELDAKQKVLFWDQVREETFEGDVRKVGSTYKIYSDRNDTDSRSNTIYFNADGTVSDDSKFIPVAKYNTGTFSGGNYFQLPTKNGGLPELFYGQRVEFDVNGEKHSAYVTDWGRNYVEIEGSEAVDAIPLGPSFQAPNDARLESFESWDSLSPSQKESQMLNAIKYRAEWEANTQDYIEDFADLVEDELFTSFREIEDVRNIVGRYTKFSQFVDARGANTLSARSAGDSRKGVLSVGSGITVGGYNGIRNATFHHEFEHAFITAEGFDNDAITTAESGEWSGDDYPDLEFEEDGDQIGALQTNHIIQYLFRDYNNNGDIPNDTDFANIQLGPELIEGDVEATQSNLVGDYNADTEWDKLKDDVEPFDIIEYNQILSGDKQVLVKEVDDDTIITLEMDTGRKVELDSDFYKDAALYSPSDKDDLAFIPLEDRIDVDWEPSSSDRVRRYAETANRSLKRRLWHLSERRDAAGKLEIDRPYHTANAQESVTGMAEVFQAKDYAKAAQLTQVFEFNPEFAKAYLEIHQPSEMVETVIIDEDKLDPLEEYI